MKGLILSGGKGTRLRPITHTNAKQLVPIANKPILFYAIEALVAASVTEIGIVVGETHKEIKEACKDGSQFGAKITYIHQEEPLGLAHAVLVSEEFIKDDSFIMYLGDNMLKGGVTEFVNKFNEKKPNAQILLAKVDTPEQFGVAEVDSEGKVVKLVEKPKEPKSDLALVGVYLFDKNIFDAAKKIKPSLRGELEITDAIQFLIDNGFHVESDIIRGWWKDTGKLFDMLEANRIALDSLEMDINGDVDKNSIVEFKVVVEDGAKVVNSVIRGPAVIGKGAVIKDSFIGPFTSIDNNVSVKNSEIEHSIVLENSSIIDIKGRIENSLIGKNSEVLRADKKPITYNFMIGDSSKIVLV